MKINDKESNGERATNGMQEKKEAHIIPLLHGHWSSLGLGLHEIRHLRGF
jgi:hypothetical protein